MGVDLSIRMAGRCHWVKRTRWGKIYHLQNKAAYKKQHCFYGAGGGGEARHKCPQKDVKVQRPSRCLGLRPGRESALIILSKETEE